jgi:hypothetical protein
MTDAGRRSGTGVRRVAGLLALASVVAAGLGVHFLLPDTAATDIAGDALYAAAVYAFVILILPRRHPLLVGAIALAWCVGIELFQLTGIPLAAGAALPPAMLVVGTVFDPRDLVIYASAILVVAATDAAIPRLWDQRP